MTKERVRELIEELQKELARAGRTDQETLEMVRRLESRVGELGNPDLPDEEDSIVDLTANLEARFATDHPVAAGFIRDIIEALGNMGI